MERDFTVGGVLSESFGVFGRNFGKLFLISFALYIPILLLNFVQVAGQGESAEPNFGLLMLISLLSLLVQLIVQGAIVHGVYESLRGQPFDLERSVGVGLRRFGPVLAVALVAGLLAMLAMLFLVVPGIIVACMFFVVVPAAVVERVGVGDALERSRALTAGRRLRIFGLVAVLSLIGFVFVGVQYAGKIALAENSQVSTVIDACISATSTALSAVVAAVSYYRLRVRHDGIDLDQLASVFD